MDTNAWVYRAETNEKSAYFIKLKKGCHTFPILELLKGAGIEHIIFPVPSLHKKLTHQIADFTLVVYPFIEGQNGFERSLTAQQWNTLGKTLRQVHMIAIPSLLKIPQETYSPKYREAVRAVLSKIEHSEIKLINFIKTKKELILKLIEKAEQLAKELQKSPQEFVLCHSDIHGGNVLIDKNGAIYIIDWDQPIMAPKERDLMFINGGVGGVWNCAHEEALFYEGYAQADINKLALAYYRCERIVEDIALYCESMLAIQQDNKDREEMYAQFTMMFAPNGVVEIALRHFPLQNKS
jgi:spectinomycin phosphotransferase